MAPLYEEQQVAKDQTLKNGQDAIRELWDQAEVDFKTICGKSFPKGKMRTFEEVKWMIENDRSKASHDKAHAQQDGWEKAKDWGLKSLECLKFLANVAAQASSLLPLPQAAANLTSSALGLVFDVPQAIRDYNDAVSKVFQEISITLAQSRMYEEMEKVDQDLLRQIHAVMVSFVKLSAHVVKYQQGGNKARTLQKIKSIFKDDSGLAEEMAVFRRELQHQRDLESTKTLTYVVNNRKDIVLLVERTSMLQMTLESTYQGVQSIKNDLQPLRTLGTSADRVEKLNKIRDALELPAPDVETINETWKRYSGACYEDTGSWIWDHEAYTKWTASKEENARPQVLLISGPSNSGKSSASALIVRQLQDQQDRTYVAHYFFPPKRQGNKKQDSDTKQAINQVYFAAKSMAYQIANADTTVLNALYNASQNAAEFRSVSDLNELWERLKVGAPGSRATYYLVFDGIDNLTDPQAQILKMFILSFQRSEHSKLTGNLRILASAKQETFDTLNITATWHIRMEDENQPDMRIFVDQRLKDQNVLQRQKPNADQQMVKEMILECLPKNSRGSYTTLRVGLDEIVHQLQSRVSIKDLMHKLRQPISSHEAAIETLQRSLSRYDIDELNEMLKWVYPFDEKIDSLSVRELEAAMVLSAGTDSVLSLQETIENKYSTVLRIEGGDDGDVHVQDIAIKVLKKENATFAASLEARESASISMTIAVKNVDPETCGNFLWDLAHKANREKFKFDFEACQASNNSTGRIAVDELDARHTIILSTFQYLKAEPNERTREIGHYLVCWLPDHLAGLHALQDKHQFLTHQERQEIGRNLYTLFKDRTIYERHRIDFENTFWSVDDMKGMREWLTDMTAMSGIQDNDEKFWRNRMKGINSPARGYLQCFAHLIVESLLRGRSSNVWHLFYWVERLRDADEESQREPLQRYTDETHVPSSSSTDTDITDWDQISEWCRGLLGLSESELDSLWYERLASTALLHDSRMEEARRLFRRALEKESPSWLCHRGLGTAFDSEENFLQAMLCFERALKEADKEEAVPKPEQKDLFDLQLLIGRCALDLEDTEKAMRFYLSASDSEETEQGLQAQFGHMKAVMRSSNPQDVTKWLQDTLSKQIHGRGLHEILKMAAKSDDHGYLIPKMFTMASRNLETLKGVARAMETETARPPLGSESPNITDKVEPLPGLDEELEGILRYYRGLATYIYGNEVSPEAVDPSTEALKLWEACRLQLASVPSDNAYLVRKRAKVNIAQHYFDDILEKGRLGDSGIDRLTELVKSESQVQADWGASIFLSALYSHYPEKNAQSRAPLARMVKQGLDILSDDTPENDSDGFYLLWQALLHSRDFAKATIALSLCVSRDALSEILSPYEDVQGDEKLEKQQLLHELAIKAIESVRDQLPETSTQYQRLSVASEHIESCIKAIGPEDHALEGCEGQGQTTPHDSETLAAYHLIQERLHVLEQDMGLICDWRWSCVGRTIEGNSCENREIYHCIYCPEIYLCKDCLGRVRERKRPADMDFTVCSSGHQWLKLPLPASGFYVGPSASHLRAPKVHARPEDYQIWEVSVDGDETVDVKEWKADLARDWDIVLEGGPECD